MIFVACGRGGFLLAVNREKNGGQYVKRAVRVKIEIRAGLSPLPFVFNSEHDESNYLANRYSKLRSSTTGGKRCR